MAHQDRYLCPICKRQERCTTEGSSKKASIHVTPLWTRLQLTVLDNGEHCLPCPTCETNEDGERTIANWDHADLRLHKRLRQHHVRYHHSKLNEIFTKEEIANYYADARRLRCELIHGPQGPGHAPQLDQGSDTLPRVAPTTPVKPVKGSQKTSPITPTRRRAPKVQFGSPSIDLPDSFLEWLRNEVQPTSVTTYASITRSYLAWYHRNISQHAVLADVWDMDAVTGFVKDLKNQVAPTTTFNYVCALQAAQRFVRMKGEANPSESSLMQFASLLRQASRAKSRHGRKVAEDKKQNSVKLYEVKDKILNNREVRTKFSLYARLSKRGEPLSQNQHQWATGFAIFILQASNFKRNGNITKIPYKQALRRIKKALKRREPCEIEINDAAKTGGKERFVIVKRHRLKILFKYATLIRAAVAGSESSSFFVNSVGHRIHSASPFITALGKSVGLPNLTIKDLRTRIETEAAIKGKKVDRDGIARHLAHSKKTRDHYYILSDRRRSRSAAMDVDKLVENAEPPETSEDDDEADQSSSNIDAFPSSSADSADQRDGSESSMEETDNELRSKEKTPQTQTFDQQVEETTGQGSTSFAPIGTPAGPVKGSSTSPDSSIFSAEHGQDADKSAEKDSESDVDKSAEKDSESDADADMSPGTEKEPSPIVRRLRFRTITNKRI